MTEELDGKKGKPISQVLKEIQKKFSKKNPDIIFDPNKQYEVVSSGNISYDLMTGIGGFPKGRITELCAMESTGKTSLLLCAMGFAQKKGQICVLFDYEQCFDPYYAERCYDLIIDHKTFFLFQPTCIEEGDAIFDALLESDLNIDLMCFDSIACMIPQALSEGSLEDNAQVGIHARYISRFMHKLKKECFAKNFAAVCTNQFKFQIQRDRFTPGIGVAASSSNSDQLTTPGGIAPRFLASIRVKMTQVGQGEKTDDVNPITGEQEELVTTKKIRFINIKNKCARPELRSESFFDLVTPTQKGGWNSGKDLMDLLRKRGRITQNGATFKYIGLNIPEFTARGKANGEAQFLNTPEILEDGYALLAQLRKEDPSFDLLVDKAVFGEDITVADKAGQDHVSVEIVENISEDTVEDTEKPKKRGRPAKISEAGDTTL
jgi:recombination protein RecA